MVDQPDVTEIRTRGAHERVSVKRVRREKEGSDEAFRMALPFRRCGGRDVVVG